MKSYFLQELSCREASEMGGDWILYFISESSYQHFCSKFAEVTDCSYLVSSVLLNKCCMMPEVITESLM